MNFKDLKLKNNLAEFTLFFRETVLEEIDLFICKNKLKLKQINDYSFTIRSTHFQIIFFINYDNFTVALNQNNEVNVSDLITVNNKDDLENLMVMLNFLINIKI